MARRLPAAYNRGMSQPPDAGPPATWQREILLRGILALLTAGLMLGVNTAANRFGSPTDLPYFTATAGRCDCGAILRIATVPVTPLSPR